MESIGVLGRAGGPGLFDENESFLIPIAIPQFVGQVDAIAGLVVRLEEIAKLLDSGIGVDEVPEQDEPFGANNRPITRVAGSRAIGYERVTQA